LIWNLDVKVTSEGIQQKTILCVNLLSKGIHKNERELGGFPPHIFMHIHDSKKKCVSIPFEKNFKIAAVQAAECMKYKAESTFIL
jgi:hypothetical protein